MTAPAHVRHFDTGATRDLDISKLDYEGFLSPLVVKRFAEYMHKHRTLPDGTYRDSDNWQRGIPLVAYIKSGCRHQFDWWSEHRGIQTPDGIEEAICAVLFNAQGYLHEYLKAKHAHAPQRVAEPAVRPGSPDAAVEELMPPGAPPLAVGD